MTHDEIIQMAEKCGIPEFENYESQADNIVRFANLVAAKERERIIEVVERLGTWAHITEVVAEIRGEA